jgi:hypothetical protein
MKNRWQLYEEREYKKINAILDNRFNELISAAKIQVEAGEDPIFAGRNARRQMEDFMDSIDDYGASDTEPRVVLVTSICSELNLPLDQEIIDQLQ